MKLSRATRVELVGRGTLNLGPQHFMASGGEATVYRATGTVVKLYTDPTKMSQPGMQEKLMLLAALQHEDIVAPCNLVLDSRGEPIGYYMDFVEGGEPLSSIFTNDFRQRTGFGDKEASLLVDRMLRVMAFAHQSDAIMVDPNELNWTTVLAVSPARDPRALDVDSWLTPGHRPPTIPMMASIRDWHSPKVGRETDRFALAVVTFQVYTGTHPYKGTLDGFKRSDLEGRMKANASVFTPGVSLNLAVRDFNCIPGSLLGWYQAVFEQGERSEPPSPLQTGVTAPARQVKVARVITTAAGTLKYQRLLDLPGDPIIRIFPCGVVLTRSLKLIDVTSSRQIGTAREEACELVKADDGWLLAEDGGAARYVFIDRKSLQEQELSVNLNALRLVRYQNRLFGVTEQGLAELHLKQFARPVLSVGQTWQATMNATHWYDGVGVLNAMGSIFLIVPFGADSCAQVRVRELDDVHVVAAKAGPRFVSVIAIDKSGDYRKIEFTFNRLYGSYEVWTGEADGPELNMSLLPRGVAATVVRDGELVIFVPTSGQVNRVADKDVATTMLLGNLDDTVVFIRDGQLWRVSLS